MSRVHDALLRPGPITEDAVSAAAADQSEHAQEARDLSRTDIEWFRRGLRRSRRQPSSRDDFWARVAARDSIPRSGLDQLTQDEEFKLVQRVFRLSGPSNGQTVLFAAVDENAAGTMVCARTAETLASRVERPVCVADAYLRESSLHEYLGATPAHGLLDLLRDGGPARNVAQQICANLWLLSSTSVARPGDPHKAVMSQRMRTVFKELREQFDYVLINAPPFSRCPDSMLLSELSDGVVLVVEAHATRRERARSVKENLAAAGVPLLGVVLNNRTFPIPDALYRRL